MIEVTSTEALDAFGGVRCDACPDNRATIEVGVRYPGGGHGQVVRLCVTCATELSEALRRLP